MIFDEAIRTARAKLDRLNAVLAQLRQTRGDLSRAIAQYKRHWDTFEQRAVEAGHTGEKFLAVEPYGTVRPDLWQSEVDPRERRRITGIRDRWSRLVAQCEQTGRKLDRKIGRIDQQKARLESWIQEKEALWGKIDPKTLKEQIRQILVAASELSTFLLGKEVHVAFDTRDGAPLGHVPIRKRRETGRKVYLTVELLGLQPEHLLDYYRALIVHELGHLLLHLKDSSEDYRELRRLLRKKISIAPGFFKVFNILLDEQLERVLRDTRKEWQRWFNRLDFFVRRIPVGDFRQFLVRQGKTDPDAIIQDLAACRIIKRYDDPRVPFVTIQSARLFSEGLGFPRLYAFWSVFAQKLPVASIEEPWLKQCLECIPRDFKSLDLFAIHALAVKIYKILMEGSAEASWLTVSADCGGARGTIEVEVPGVWLPAQDGEPHVQLAQKKRRLAAKGRLEGRSAARQQVRQPAATQTLNPEGEPPPPPPPPPVESQTRDPPRPPVLRVKRGRQRADSVRLSPSGGGSSEWSSSVSTPSPVSDATPKRRRTKSTPSARSRLKHRPSKISAKEKNRLRKAAKEEARRKAASKAPQAISPQKVPSPQRRLVQPASSSVDLEAASKLAAASEPPTSLRNAAKQAAQSFEQLLDQVRKEMADQRSGVPEVDRIAPEHNTPSDFRNLADVRSFPRAERTLRLLPDPAQNRRLARAVGPLVRVLRPYLAALDQEKVLEERLLSGRRLLASGLTKHLTHGDVHLFADHRMAETESHRDCLVAVLIDTSSSMKTDGRLERALRVATLLGECLSECAGVESVFLGYNQDLYLCGNHDGHSIGSLQPSGKTNEAAAIEYLREPYLAAPRRRKLVVVLSDGLPTSCSVESVRWLVRCLEKELGVRFLYGALSKEEHPAYPHRADLAGEIGPAAIRNLGKKLRILLV